MVSITKTNYTTTDKSGTYFIGELACKSTDTKPTEIDSMKVGNVIMPNYGGMYDNGGWGI